jgi:hypothetical protein
MNGEASAKLKFDPAIRLLLNNTSPLFLQLIESINDARILSQNTFEPNSLASDHFTDHYAKDFLGSYEVDLLTVTPTAALYKHTTVSLSMH